jgi:hypothetical protein
MSLKHWYFSFVFLLVANVSLGQVYPVQVNSTVVPPYLSSVAEYATTINQKYMVNLFTADLNVVNRQARLKLYIEGNGIQAQSLPIVIGANPIYLNGGETVNLTNLDLAPYFRLENLQGINQKQYGGVLPQGSYKYCIEVYDYLTNQRISQKSCTFFYFLYNEPPLLNVPANHDVLFFQEPQNIIFTWTPRHINATNIEYEFELVELLDNQAPSNYAFQVGAPVFSTTTNTTVLHYGPAEPQLIAGRKYAWRVKAISQAGFGETAVFNNNGYSEIYDFVYPGNCEAPKFVLASAVNATQAKINWQPDPKHLDYKVEYRKLTTETWFETAHYNNEAKIYDLEPGATYEFRVGGECLGNIVTYSTINTFTQPTANTVAINCGIQPEIDLANQQVFTGELPNDQTIMAGDFAIKITDVSGSGAYSGKGYTAVPYLSKVRIGVEFKDIILNTDFKLIKGEIKAVYDPEWSNILDVSGIYDQIENVFDMISPDTDEHSFEVDFVIGNASDIQVNDNTIVVTGSNGESQTFDLDQGEMVIIRDEKGNVYGIAPGASEATLLNPNESAGFIPKSENTEGVSSNGTATSFATIGARATFKKATSSKYADDQKPENADDKIKKLYKSIADGNTTYDLYHKGIQNDGKASRSFDYIEAIVTITDSSIKEENILFNIKGTKPKEISKTVTTNGIVYILEVPVFETAATAELMALVKAGSDKNKLIGAAKIIPIKTQPDVNITLVPVNNATIPDGITTQLNAIYAEAGVQFKVTIAPNHEVAKNTLECGKDALLDKLSEDQSQFVEQYKAGKDIKKDQYYVFVTKGITPSRAISGFMPRHSQFGFVFTNQSGEEVKAGNDLATIIGHELGHGVFELEHPWEQFSTGDKNSNTPWLMDYDLGTKLAYPHWQRISHPKFGLYVFDGSEKGELGGAYDLDPNLNPIYVRSNYIHVSQNSANLPFGVLRGFMVEKNNQKLFYSWNGSKYVDNTGKEPEKGVLSSYNKSLDGSQTVLLYDYLAQCKVRYMYVNFSDIKGSSAEQIKIFFNSNYQKYAKLKFDKEIYKAGITYCYQNSTDVIDKSVKKQDADLDNSSEIVIDYNKVFTREQLTKFHEKLTLIKSETGIEGKVLVTKSENSDDINKVKEILAQLKQKDIKGVYVWANYTSQDNFDFQVAYSKGFSDSEKQAFDRVIQAANKNKDGLIQLGIQGEKFNPLTAIFDGLASIIRKAKIPERFYNPEIKTGDYNPILYYVSLADPYSFGTFLNDQQLRMLNINIANSSKVGTSHIYFAIKCGVWNGIVEQVAGLSDTAGIISDLFSGGDRASELWEGLKRLDIWCTETKGPENVCIWSLLKQAHTGQTCQVAEQVGVDAANVLTIAISFAKVGQVAKVAQLMESLDAMSQVLKLTGKVIKPVLVGTGKTAKIVFKVTKAFLQPGVKFTKLNGRLLSVLIPIPIDLTPNLEAAINKAKELLATNKEAFDLEVQLKNDVQGVEIKDQNGNLVGEITVDGQKIEVLVNPDESKLKESVEEILNNAGKITTTAELKAFLNTVDETTTIVQLEQKGIKSFFRGTTRSKADNSLFPGNPNSQAFGISTSTDPIKATIFSIESATSNGAYKGILQIGLPNDLKNITLSAPNYRVAKELEVVLNTPANNFANLSKVEISVDNARKLVKEVYGVDLPYNLSRSYADELLETIPESSLDKAFEFYQKAIQYNIK